MDREQIEARAEAATPGPWINNRNGVVTVESHPLAPTVSENSSWGDADFIAHARTDIDDLLTVIAITDKALDSAVEEIETLTARNAKLEAVAKAAVVFRNDPTGFTVDALFIAVNVLESKR